jgi:putative oxidoreductase
MLSSSFAHAIEWIVFLSILFGIGLRYGALLGFVFVVIALLIAHRYWELSLAVQGLQYVFFTKDIAIAGGLLALFIAGPGRFSIDEFLKV